MASNELCATSTQPSGVVVSKDWQIILCSLKHFTKSTATGDDRHRTIGRSGAVEDSAAAKLRFAHGNRLLIARLLRAKAAGRSTIVSKVLVWVTTVLCVTVAT